MNISLNPEIQQMIAQRIASGQYADASEVIGDALRRTESEWDDGALKAFLAPRIAAAERGEVEQVNAQDFLAIARGELR
jgi:putative addiction module CopG family antidote